MKIVIDTNAIMASLIRNSSSRRIILSPKLDLFAPDFSFEEINNHREEICAKAGITEREFSLLLSILSEKITIVGLKQYESFMKESKEIMKNTDINDSPFIACALYLKADGIWTEDKDFLKQNKIKILSTKNLLEII